MKRSTKSPGEAIAHTTPLLMELQLVEAEDSLSNNRDHILRTVIITNNLQKIHLITMDIITIHSLYQEAALVSGVAEVVAPPSAALLPASPPPEVVASLTPKTKRTSADHTTTTTID